jgi:hypothetical protein
MKPGLCTLAKLIEVAGYQLDCELIPATHNRLDYPEANSQASYEQWLGVSLAVL